MAPRSLGRALSAEAETEPGAPGRSAAPTERTRLRRIPERGAYDPAVVRAIVDEALIVHVAWVDDDGSPRQIPTLHARVGDTLYVHGSRASQTMRALRGGAEVCITATIVDALVLARSLFHHSMNYRSVVVYGRAREVTDREEFDAMARALADHVAPGRGADARLPNEDEFRQKIRTGPPMDDDDDLGLPVWAGTLPLGLATGEPEPDPTLADGIAPPSYVTDYRRPTA